MIASYRFYFNHDTSNQLWFIDLLHNALAYHVFNLLVLVDCLFVHSSHNIIILLIFLFFLLLFHRFEREIILNLRKRERENEKKR